MPRQCRTWGCSGAPGHGDLGSAMVGGAGAAGGCEHMVGPPAESRHHLAGSGGLAAKAKQVPACWGWEI